MAVNIKPLADRVLVEAAPAEEKQQLASSFPIPLKKNHNAAKLSLWATAKKTSL
jgi:co-chaperonin GroES (HSP10)